MFSFINIFGLSISLSISMILIMMVADQMSYDRYNSKKERIFRINTQRLSEDDFVTKFATAPLPLATALLDNYPGIESAVRIRRGFGNDWITIIEQDVNIPLGGFFADPGVLDLFEYELEHGNPETALIDPYSVVITRKAADKLFDIPNPVGEIIKVGELGNYKITGVIKDRQQKSHIKFEALASIASLEILEKDSILSSTITNWRNSTAGWIYLELDDASKMKDVEKNLGKIYAPHYQKLLETADKEDVNHRFYLQNLTAITPGPLLANQIGPGMPVIFVYFFAGLVLIIIVSSCFNYTNLSIARSLSRAREVGIRKVSGAFRYQIFFQFISESIIIALLALAFSFVLIALLKPAFQSMKFTQLLQWDLNQGLPVVLFGIGYAVVVGIFAGLFPSLFLSSFKPATVLKDLNNMKLFSKINLRKALIVAQFCLSMIFIISVTLIYNQLQMMVKANYGFNTKDIVNVRLGESDYNVLKNEFEKHSSVLNVSGASHIPAAGTSKDIDIKLDPAKEDEFEIKTFSVDGNYLVNMDIQLIAGSNFPDNMSDEREQFVLINEQAVELFGFGNPIDALDKVIYIKDTLGLQVIGVIEDYNHQAMMVEIAPMVLRYDPKEFRHLQVRVNNNGAIKNLEDSWSKLYPDKKFNYRHMDDEIAEFYEIMFSDLVNITGLISFLAISIACLGLLGMAIYSTQTRIKEISIRKVLGATDSIVVYLLSKSFIKLLLISIVLAIPSAYALNTLWLQALAFRVPISLSVISFGVAIILTLGLLTIGSQTLMASRANPVDALRNQ